MKIFVIFSEVKNDRGIEIIKEFIYKALASNLH